MGRYRQWRNRDCQFPLVLIGHLRIGRLAAHRESVLGLAYPVHLYPIANRPISQSKLRLHHLRSSCPLLPISLAR